LDNYWVYKLLPPTQPSPTGEGVEVKHFPLGGNGKGGQITQLLSDWILTLNKVRIIFNVKRLIEDEN